MSALATDKSAKQPSAGAAFERAAIRVMLGAPPALVAADLGCDITTLMRWVKNQRRVLRQAARPEEPAPAAEAPAPVAQRFVPASIRHVRDRQFTADRPVEPENTALVEAAYQAAEFDYSGRRIRQPTTH
jgi:hypothetical protein